MEREAVLVGIDVGTSKVCTLIGEVSRDGRMTVMGHGTVPSLGLKKGVVVNIDQTVRSIAESVERAERLSGWKIDRAFVAVILTFIGDRLSLDLYLVALINFGFRIFNNVALIRRHFV